MLWINTTLINSLEIGTVTKLSTYLGDCIIASNNNPVSILIVLYGSLLFLGDIMDNE